MSRIKSESSDHVYVGQGNRVIIVPQSKYHFCYDYAVNKNQNRKYGRRLIIESNPFVKSEVKVRIELGGKELNAIKKMLALADKEMSAK